MPDTTPPPSTAAEERVKIYVHDSSFSTDELLLHPKTFPDVPDGAVVFLEAGAARVVLRATLLKEDGDEGSSRLRLSLLKPVAERCGVKPWADASVSRCHHPERDAAAEFVEFMFKDQFVSRADMWRFKRLVLGRTLHAGQALAVGGMRATAHTLRGVAGVEGSASGLLVPKTRFVFRTRSSRIFWLVQMSYETWEPTGGADGFLHVERLVDGFAAPLLARWRALDVNHSLSVVLFARVADVDTRARDVYRVVLENVEKADPATLVAALKRELVAFARSLATVVPADRLRVCRAADGNVLEAINLTLNVLEKHYMDRDTLRTGNSIVLVSAGAGVFSVDARLAQITKQRMMDNGIGMDMLSLAVPPLHTAPIFMFRGRSGPRATAYEVPHWINLSFVDPERAADPNSWIVAAAPRRARDDWRMARLDLLRPGRNSTTSPPTSPRRSFEGDDPATRRAVAARRKRLPDLLAHLVRARADAFAVSPPPPLPRRLSGVDGALRGSSLSTSPGSALAASLAASPGLSLDDAASSSLASSVGAPWRPSIILGSLGGEENRTACWAASPASPDERVLPAESISCPSVLAFAASLTRTTHAAQILQD